MDRVFDRYLEGERPLDFDTTSGIPIEASYGPSGPPMSERPGAFPFTRGIHPEMYRKRFWTRRQQSGFGTPADSNERLIYLLKIGQTGLNVDYDVTTKLSLDPDHPLAEGDVGMQGTSVATLEDVDVLHRDIPLDKVSATLICQPPTSAFMMAAYVRVAQKRGVAPDRLIGTIMNCGFTQLVGPTYLPNTVFFPIEFTHRIGLDVMEYCAREMPKWNIVNVNAYNIRETGVNAVQEAAFAMMVASEHIEGLLARGLDIDSFAPRIAFFTAAHLDFFEEIAKLRAMRRIWAKMMRERYGAKNDRSCWFRTAIQTAALVLTAQQPMNNIVRAGIQTLAAVLGGSQSIHTTGWDEAFALPTEDSHKLSIRTQQVIAYETNVTKTVDPLGGSYFVEALTDRMETEITHLMEEMRAQGGYLELFKQRWIEDRITEARFALTDRIEAGRVPVVGVNCFQDEDDKPPEMRFFRIGRPKIEERIAYIRAYRAARDQAALARALARLREDTAMGVNVMPAVFDAVDAQATIGEIGETFRQAIGHSLPY
ncbi:MAG TPA: methylmalonyl-CoA mutase family protein [Xanthobacteraceae bacterium]